MLATQPDFTICLQTVYKHSDNAPHPMAMDQPAWDLRAAICAIGAAQVKDHSDETLMFLLRSAIDRKTVDVLFDEIFRRYHSRVSAWCLRLIRDREQALDLTQEVFLRAFRRMHTYRGDSRFSTWLFAITRNHCLNSLKKRNTEPAETGEIMPDELWGSDGMEIHTAIERRQSFLKMWNLIEATLSPMEARVMALHYGHELPLAVITRELLLSNPSGAKAYIVNARRKLNAMLGKNESRRRSRATPAEAGTRSIGAEKSKSAVA